MDIALNLNIVHERIDSACKRTGRSPADVTLIAVTKTVDAAAVEAAHNTGIRNFGESRVQQAVPKIQELTRLQPSPTWHLVGHLQSNKVKVALENFDIIHSIDSVNLAKEISRRALKPVRILLQVNVACEESKHGFVETDLEKAFEAIGALPNIEVMGLMTIAPIVEDVEETRPVFRRLRQLRDSLCLQHLSMGMTDDFEVAVEEGATMVRIGRAIFGASL